MLVSMLRSEHIREASGAIYCLPHFPKRSNFDGWSSHPSVAFGRRSFCDTPPWSVEKIPGGLKVCDANGQSLAYVYSRENASDAHMAKVLTEDEARRIASNIAKLPILLRKELRHQLRSASFLLVVGNLTLDYSMPELCPDLAVFVPVVRKRRMKHAQTDHYPRNNSNDSSGRLHRRESRGGDNDPTRKSGTS